MRKTICFIAPLVAAGAAAAIVAAPIASAEAHLECSSPSANSTQCETPGNVQLNSSPGTIAYPQYPYPYLYGGQSFNLRGLFGGGGHQGGGAGGGHQ